jgi:N-methylhydantoinase A
MSSRSDPPRPIRIGIDVGGTFTDVFLLDERSGVSVRHKLPSTPEDPYRAPVRGIADILAKAGLGVQDVGFVGLGTTVATNALIERTGAVTGLLTTRGFRDVLEVGRQRRPHTYDLFARRPAPLVPRELRLEVRERIAADGSVLEPLDEAEVEREAARLLERGAHSIAVCLLNSYANPDHEQRIVRLLRSRWPDVPVTGSAELIGEFREYERLCSTVLNAYLMPVMKRYLTRFGEEVAAMGIGESPWVMSSGGGVVSAGLAIDRPIDLLLSGPSGGVSGALFHATTAGHRDLITFDMGGTSTDVCLIRDALPDVAYARSIGGLPIRSTAFDVHAVGAGGSSIAWIDDGGMLRVGPRSAGADPGPACYGRPDARPTVTDANVVLGRLNPHHLLDGALPIDAARSAQAIERDIAGPKRLGLHEAAAAILAVSNVHIAQAIRFVSVERGLDPKDFVLVAFGGAGPLHAADVARELGMRVLVPPAPGVLCAMGVLTKDVALDLSRTRPLRDSAPGAAADVDDLFATLQQRAADAFSTHGMDAGRMRVARKVDARYVGQNFELSVPVAPGRIDAAALQAIRSAFNAAHVRLYGYDLPDRPIELITFRVQASLAVPKPAAAAAEPARGSAAAPRAHRPVFFDLPQRFVDCPVWRRADLAAGARLTGPAIVEQMDTTTVVPTDFEAETDRWGNLLLTRRSDAAP